MSPVYGRQSSGFWVENSVRYRLGTIVDATKFAGVVADGTTNDTVALNTGLANMSAGQTAQIPEGRVILHSSDYIVLPVSGTRLIGPGTLLGSNINKCALVIRGNHCSVEGNLIKTFTGGARTPGLYTHGIVIDGATDTIINCVRVNGAAATGIKASEANGYVIANSVVHGCMADGIHNTDSSKNGLIVNPVVFSNGDDSISIVSYTNDSNGPCFNIKVIGARVSYSNPKGRGLTVVGGHDISFEDCDVLSPDSSGIYIAVEGVDAAANFHTVDVKAITYKSIRITNACVGTNNGAVMIANVSPTTAPYVIDDIVIDDLTITNTNLTAVDATTGTPTTVNRQIRATNNPSAVTRLNIRNAKIIGGPSTIWTTDLAAANFKNSNWRKYTNEADTTGSSIADVGTFVPIR